MNLAKMNLPIKLVDIVTLLFLSLLVVIIVFIILQRNIKRIKLRNKDSHYLNCKSIPQDLKDAIEKKHIISNSYNEPPQLLAESHLNQTDEKAKNYILRMKAFEVAKNLENALAECGYIRGMSKKFEDFVDIDLVLNTEDKTLPKSLLNDFVVLFIWAMHDPLPFTRDKLRKLNQLINKIITILAFNKTDKHDQIIQHKLDLDNLGDFDFNKLFTNKNSADSNLNNNNNDNLNVIERRKLSRFHQQQAQSNETSSNEKIEADNLDEIKDNSKFNKKNKVTKNSSIKSKKLFQTKSSKYEEIKEGSKLESSSFSNSKLNFMKRSKQDLNETNESQMNSDWTMTNDRNFDSENEEIPLVATKKTSTHQKKKSNLSNILIGAPSKSSSNQGKTSPSNSILLNTVTSNPSGTLQMTSNIDCGGNENEGFNKTFETIF